MNDLYSIHDIVRSNVESLLMSVYTSIPAKVISYDSVKQTVKVKIAVTTPTQRGENIPAGTYNDIQVVFPSASKWVIAGPIAAGDVVLLIVPHYGTKEYTTGDRTGTGDAEFVTRHELNDAIAITGMFTTTSVTRKAALKDKFHLANGETSNIVIDEDNITITVGGTILSVSAAGIDMTGVVTINGVAFSAHVHPYNDTPVGAAITAPPTPA